MDSDLLEFHDEPPVEEHPDSASAWKVLVVDDEPEVHRITHLTLDDFRYQDQPLAFIEAYSAADAINCIAEHPDIAVVLLDVVMETDDAGFKVVEYIRNTLANHNIRVILRTGQPGQAPARQAVRKYEINDYHSKAELTAERMHIAVYTALAMFNHLQTIQRREQQLQMAYAEIEQLVYIASHDLREPLLSVTTLSQRLLEMKRDQIDAEGQLCLEYIGTAVRRMSALVHDLLDYSKLGQPQPSEVVSLHDLVDELRQDMATAIANSHAEIVCPALPTTVGDRQKIKLLLQNLISNAIKYRRSETPPRIEIKAQRDGPEVVYAVSDNGIGIPDVHFRKIFDVFFRLHHRDEFEGTGIGLAHCNKVVVMHGGRIWVESELGSGSTFYFTLPGKSTAP